MRAEKLLEQVAINRIRISKIHQSTHNMDMVQCRGALCITQNMLLCHRELAHNPMHTLTHRLVTVFTRMLHEPFQAIRIFRQIAQQMNLAFADKIPG